jgi:intracellular sulfur oxidation DsrE/DsrF family protein
MTHRRHFLAQMALGAAGLAVDADELRASAPAAASGAWDTSWIPRVEAAKYRVVFNASDISDGAVFDYALTFFEHFRDAHGTADSQTTPVIVARRLGTALGLNDAMWDRYRLGEDTKIVDENTKLAARRNVFWTAGASTAGAKKIDTLQRRGMIMLVCNVAVGNMGYRLATRDNRNVDEVQAELRANLVPGAILVPSGIYALIRAQNAGCAYMPGT